MKLVKEVLTTKGSESFWELEYELYPDYTTMRENVEDNTLTLNFNSNNLEDLLMSYQNEKFELENNEDLDGNVLPNDLETNNILIKGREIVEEGQSKLLENMITYSEDTFERYITPLTTLVFRGNDRHSSVDTESIGPIFDDATASNSFFSNSVELEPSGRLILR